MRRLITAAAIGLFGALLMTVPASATPSTTTASSTTTTTIAPASTTTMPSSTTTTTIAPKRARIARARAAADATVTVSTDCTAFCFRPSATTVVAGTTVTWVDKSGTAHNITRCTATSCDGQSGGTGTDPAFAKLTLPAGGRAQYTFTQPGTYVYFCSIHGYALMHGTITVTAAAAAAPVTAAPVVADPATTVAGPQLASTGGSTRVPLAVGALLLALGCAAARLGPARRRST